MIADESVKKWFSRENGTSTADYDTALKNVAKTVIMLIPVGLGSSFETSTTLNTYTNTIYKYRKWRETQSSYQRRAVWCR